MKDHFVKPWMQLKLLKHALVGVLGMWALVSCVLIVRMKPEVVLIGIDGNGTRVISKANDPLFQTEVVNFIRHFCDLYYSYESSSFMSQVGNSTGLMTARYWRLAEPEITRILARMQETPIQQLSTLESVSKEDDGSYFATLSLTINDRMTRKNVRVKTRLRLAPAARTVKNPWGMEVDQLEEQIL